MQTGSGKTHTILGAPGDEGLLPRLIGDLFNFSAVSAGLANEVKVQCYMLELYQDTLIDMFNPADVRSPPSTSPLVSAR